MASIEKRLRNGKVRWYARYRDADDQQRTKTFDRKVDAERFMTTVAADVLRGTYVAPDNAKITVAQWCATWADGYGTRRRSTVRQAQVHLDRIKSGLGSLPIGAVKPSHVRSWTAGLRDEGLSDSYIYVLHSRFAQVMTDAVQDGIIARSPCSRRTSPRAGKQRPYVATTEQIWALHDAMPEHLRPAVSLAAFAGLRLAEVCGLRTSDVDFMRGVVHPAVQYPAEPLKTEVSRTPIPISESMTLTLSAHVAGWRAETMLTNEWGGQLTPWTLQRHFRTARATVAGLPEGFRFHDLRHFFASLLISSGDDVKIVQARLRHASAKTTLDCYAHLWPDTDQSTREAVEALFAARRAPKRAANRD
ncbi:MAG: hypothetical protein QOI06_3121 [Nocardioidaceae bacterium]|jgi:integrase|nr:hypothetical protein [Nocardioidaceae bacterium]